MRHQILPLVTAMAFEVAGCASSGRIATSWPVDPVDPLPLAAHLQAGSRSGR